MRLSKLDPETRAMVQAQMAKDDAKGSAALLRQAEGALARAVRSPHTGKGQKRGMSGTEAAFARWLDGHKATGVVSAWRYEPFRVVLPAKRATYAGDFLVRVASGCSLWFPETDAGLAGLTLFEVKPRDKTQEERDRAYWGTGKSRLKVKLAAEALSGLIPVVAVWPSADGGWSHEVIEPRGGP